MSNMEETLSIIKPDAVERNLEEKIKSIFIKNNFQITRQKKVKLEKKQQGPQIGSGGSISQH